MLKLPESLAAIFPMSGADKKRLPQNIALLSESLTSKRSRLAGRSYWSDAALSGAYLWYFLPWNLLRLMSLLPGQNLNLSAGAKILDLGSGPLTLPLALWLCRPELRELPLSFTCLDSAAQPLRLGRSLFHALAGPDSPWRFKLIPESVLSALNKQGHDFSMVSACNVLNELKPERQTSLARHLALHVEGLMRRLAPAGRLLIVEPGNRLGGKIISFARAAALERGHGILAPCTHEGACPLFPAQARREAHGQQDCPPERPGTSWCHFSSGREGALPPPWLDALSRDAHLHKDKLTLSWLLIKKEDFQAENRTGAGASRASFAGPPPPAALLPGRVVSNALPMPGRTGWSFYVCCACGLTLLHSKHPLRSGECVELNFKGDEGKDPKSGAWVLNLL